MTTLALCALFSSPSFALQVSTGPNGSNVQAVHALGYTGQGVSVGLISQDHALITHEAFAGHAHYYNATDQGPTSYLPSNHDTSVGGIICSRGGAAYPDDKGTAPDTELYSVKVTRLEGENYISAIPWMDDALSYLLDQQCKVVVTGIQLGGLPTDGSSDWSLIYDYYAYEHNLVFATAAGNYASSITVFGDTYNSITTGGLIVDASDVYYQIGSTSNSGLTSDGRQKPDVAAPSEDQWTPRAASDTSWANATPGSGGQTSWAVPHTGGVAAVLLSYADTNTDPDDNQNEVIKAVIVNSTFPNIQDKSGSATTLQTWNEDRGYGRVDALKAYQTLSGTKINPNSLVTAKKGWAYQSMTQNYQIDDYQIYGLQNERLLLTVTWNRQVTKFLNNYNEETSPKFNINLTIKSPQNDILFSETDTLNNLQKADILLPEEGYYVITLSNTTKKDRGYALAFELLDPLPADFNIDYVVDDLDLVGIVSHWLDIDCNNPIQPCYPYNLSTGDSIDLNDFSVFAQQWLTYDPRYYSP